MLYYFFFFTHSNPIFPKGVSTTELNASQDCPCATSVEEPTATPFSYNVHSHWLLQETDTITKDNRIAKINGFIFFITTLFIFGCKHTLFI